MACKPVCRLCDRLVISAAVLGGLGGDALILRFQPLSGQRVQDGPGVGVLILDQIPGVGLHQIAGGTILLGDGELHAVNRPLALYCFLIATTVATFERNNATSPE